MAPVRFGVVGVCGIIGATHVRAIQAVPDADIASVTDLNETAGRRVADAVGCRWDPSFDWMLKRTDVDAVCLCTPHNLHAAQALAAFKKGKHVLTERPMALTVKDADKMIAAAEQGDLRLGVVFQERLRPAFAACRKLVADGRLGRVYRATLVHTAFKTQSYFDSSPWRGAWVGAGGGVTLQQGSPFLDLLVGVLGMPDRVFACHALAAHEIQVEDMCSALLDLPDGVQCFAHFNTLQAPGQSYLEIVGDSATARIEGSRLRLFRPATPLKRFIFSDRSHVYAAPSCKERLIPIEDAEPGHAGVIADFCHAVRKGGAAFCDGREGRKSLEVANAIMLSAFSGKPVELPVKAAAVVRALKALADSPRGRLHE